MMTLTDGFRIGSLVFYAIGIVVFLAVVIRFLAHRDAIEKQIGRVPSAGAVITLCVPPIILLTRVGEISDGWLPLRVIGLGIGLYGMVMWLWAAQTLGRFFVPGVGVFHDHTLVTSGPFRFVRHPIYAAVFALWLGVALGTLNWLLLVLWPGFVAGVLRQARKEEGFLQAKFGTAYEDYTRRTRQLIPKVW